MTTEQNAQGQILDMVVRRGLVVDQKIILLFHFDFVPRLTLYGRVRPREPLPRRSTVEWTWSHKFCARTSAEARRYLQRDSGQDSRAELVATFSEVWISG